MCFNRITISSLLCGASLAISACAPTLDWRDVRVADGALKAQLPCKPTTHVRKLSLAGQPVNLSLMSCTAGEHTWALAWVDVADPARVSPVLHDLRDAAVANIGARTPQPLALSVPGATPHVGSVRLRLQGRRADGQPVQVQVAVFARGTVVIQATVLGGPLQTEAVDTFFASLRAGP